MEACCSIRFKNENLQASNSLKTCIGDHLDCFLCHTPAEYDTDELRFYKEYVAMKYYTKSKNCKALAQPLQNIVRNFIKLYNVRGTKERLLRKMSEQNKIPKFALSTECVLRALFARWHMITESSRHLRRALEEMHRCPGECKTTTFTRLKDHDERMTTDVHGCFATESARHVRRALEEMHQISGEICKRPDACTHLLVNDHVDRFPLACDVLPQSEGNAMAARNLDLLLLQYF